ncbi:MAG TPA: ThuA domain-containing protein [Lacunisphaera sp.]|nr:ThuA domain-containing protein [Lacunisphaera sp.]
MKISAALLAFGLAAVAVLAEPAKLRVLVLTGGHGFAREPFFRMFQDNPGIDFTAIEHTKDTADGWERADLAAADVVVLYDMPPVISPAQQERMRSLFVRGTGLVVLHHALVTEHGWPGYEAIVGGAYPVKGAPGAQAAGYRHDVTIPVVIANRGHPITAGLADFTVQDEIYWGYRVGADVTPLLTTTHPESGKPLAWCRNEGKSRVVYLQLGHGPSCFGNPSYREFLARALRWAAGR